MSFKMPLLASQMTLNKIPKMSKKIYLIHFLRLKKANKIVESRKMIGNSS